MPARASKTSWREIPAWRAVIREMPCAHCGLEGRTQAAHVRHRGSGGMGMKPADCWLIPLCGGCHHAQHQGEDPDTPRCFELLQGLLWLLWGPAAVTAILAGGRERFLCDAIRSEAEAKGRVLRQTPTWKWRQDLRAAVREVQGD